MREPDWDSRWGGLDHHLRPKATPGLLWAPPAAGHSDTSSKVSKGAPWGPVRDREGHLAGRWSQNSLMISAKREVGCSLHVVYWECQGNLPRTSVLLDPEKTSIQEKENKVK